MSDSDTPFSRQQLAQQYIPDFLEESDDHIRRSARNLLSLEKAVINPEDKSDEIEAIINDLLRSFHTLKGLSGIVGLTPAIELSHTIESVLEAVWQGKKKISTEIIDSLIKGAQTLEKVITALREENKPFSDIKAIVAELTAHLPDEPEFASDDTQPEVDTSEAEELSPEFIIRDDRQNLINLPEEVAATLDEKDWQRVYRAIDMGKSLALAIFSPSEEKAHRGITVNNIRKELMNTTDLVKAVPIMANDEVRFAFLVSVDDLANVELSPELSWTPLEVRSPVSSPSPKSPVEKIEPLRASSTVRVNIERLDELMRLVGDLIVSRSRLMDVLPQLTDVPPTALESLEQTTSSIERQLRFLREAVMRVRMVPLAEAFGRMPLLVRDLAKDAGRKVRLDIQGEKTEIDKALVERLHDPLLHLVRNAIVHGIETPDMRSAQGKPSEGVLTLSGKPEGDHIRISIADDGGGMNIEQIIKKAQAQGLLGDAFEEKSLTHEEVLDLICQPGFTTKMDVDVGAGRGVGMEIVRRMVDAVSGTMSLHTTPGQGTRFELRLPLTMTIIDALIIHLGDERYAVPRGDVQEIIAIEPERVVRTQHGELLPYRETAVPLFHLHSLFKQERVAKPDRQYGLVGGDNGSRYVMVADRVTDLREIVVHTLSDELVARPGITGATDLGNGEAVLILDLPGLRRLAREGSL
ncbi:MAG: chemotaxis protein CheA [Chloroflexi bacterium]|nr:MAG: chemotaxis protein CheA [Chloroflexota bacterium]